MTDHEKLLRELYAAIEAGSTGATFACFHPEAEQIEYPSLMRPHGHRRPIDEMRAGAEEGMKLLKEQHYDVHTVIDDGDQTAVQLTWTATTAKGAEFTAHVAAFYEFKDGLILRQSSYDCYEPLTAAAAP
jgi:ketosteroid isomerase-like protein